MPVVPHGSAIPRHANANANEYFWLINQWPSQQVGSMFDHQPSGIPSMHLARGQITPWTGPSPLTGHLEHSSPASHVTSAVPPLAVTCSNLLIKANYLTFRLLIATTTRTRSRAVICCLA